MVETYAASAGGGVYSSYQPVPPFYASDAELHNCIVYYNDAPVNPNNNGGAYYNCCTTPFPSPQYGYAVITSEPLLADLVHLSAASPCRGAGNYSYVRGIDVDGEAWANPPSI